MEIRSLLKNRKNAVVFIALLVVIATLTILGTAMMSNSLSEMMIARRSLNYAQTIYLGESGINQALEWLRNQPQPPANTQPFNPFVTQSLNLGATTGTYSVTINPDANNPFTTVKLYRIVTTGTINNVSQQVEAQFQIDTFARMAYFSDSEIFTLSGTPVSVWFVTNDHIEGPTHTNQHFNISGNPIFDGIASSVDGYINYMHGGPPNDNPAFNGGLTLGASPVPLPSKAVDLKAAAGQSGGLSLQGTTTVVLNADGTMNVTNSQKGWTNQNMSLPSNSALFVTDGNVTVSGTLNGKLSIGTNRNIIIPNNILYHEDPRTVPTTQDVLGLIAERDVLISHSAPNNLEIDASIMALGESFMLDGWWYDLKGTLTVYGGIIQKERGPVGTFNSSTNQKVSGYSKDYHYDARLVSNPPPYYPTTGDYVMIAWREQ
jgi:Tfp pilus assembly protein PilX